MALTKVHYTDNETVIGAKNLNDIQDEIIANGNNINFLNTGKVDKVAGKGLSTLDFTVADRQAISNAYVKPTAGVPKTDLSQDVQTSLDKADNSLQAALDETLTVQGAAADAKATGDAVGELKSAINSVKNLEPGTKTFESGTAFGNVGGTLSISDNAARCRIRKSDMSDVDIISKDGYDFYVYYTNSFGIIQSKTDNWVTKHTVANDNMYGVTIVARKTSNADISAAEAEANILFTFPIIEAVADVRSDITTLANRVTDLDGEMEIDPTLFVIGTINISTSGWSTVSSTKRVSSDINHPIHIEAGDIVRLTDYDDARFYLGWRRANNTYGTTGAWLQVDYVCPETADYVITISNDPEVVISSKSDLLDLLQIIDKDSMAKKVDTLSGGLYAVPEKFTAEQVYSETYESMKAVQGLCTDGTYLYQAVMEVLGQDASETTIKKIRISDMTLVDSETGVFGHCNDLAYDPTNNYILSIYKSSANYSVVTRFNADTLEKIDDIDLSSIATSIGQSVTLASITYATDIGRYIVGAQSGTDLIGFAVVKPDWTLERVIKVIPQNRVLQGIDYNNGIIYLTSDKQYTKRRIYAYDLHGNVINYTENEYSGEIEGIAVADGVFYLSYNPSSYKGLYIFEAEPVYVGVSIASTMAKYNLNY